VGAFDALREAAVAALANHHVRGLADLSDELLQERPDVGAHIQVPERRETDLGEHRTDAVGAVGRLLDEPVAVQHRQQAMGG
jgi:hypothetical protein